MYDLKYPAGRHLRSTEQKRRPEQSAGEPREITARRLLRQAGHAGNYPHNTHPALVPRVSVDDQRVDYSTDRVVGGVVGVVTAIIAGFFIWGIVAAASLSAASAAALDRVTGNFSWLFTILAAVILVFMIVFYKDLRSDPAAIRHRYARSMINDSVFDGVRRYGDDFGLTVREATDGTGAGADFDSEDASVTSWYQRHDENGDPIEYDYETGQYVSSEVDADTHATPSGREVTAKDGVRVEEE